MQQKYCDTLLRRKATKRTSNAMPFVLNVPVARAVQRAQVKGYMLNDN